MQAARVSGGHARMAKLQPDMPALTRRLCMGDTP
jgi:hypothetical protein